MKPNYPTMLLLVVASLSMPVTSRSANYTAEIEPTPLWSQTTGTPAAASARSMAVSAGRVYTVNHTEKNVYYTEGNGWKTIDKTALPSGVEIGVSPMIASDDAGNLIIPVSPAFPSSQTINDTKFVVLEAGATSVANVIKDDKKDEQGNVIKGDDGNPVKEWRYFTIPANTISDAGRIDFISASGQVRTNGGWIYFYPGQGANAGKVVRTWGTWGGYKNKTEVFTGGLATSSLSAYPKVVKGSDGTEILLQTGTSSNKAALYSMTEGGGVLTLLDAAPYSSALLSGTKVKYDADRQFYVYAAYESSGWNVTKTMLNVKNTVTGAETSLDLNRGSWSASSYAAGMWVDAEFADANTIYVYCYMPGQGAWKYKVNVTLGVQPPATPTSAAVSIVTLTEGQPGRQDALLTWDAVTDAATYTVSKYVKDGDEYKWKVIASGLTACTYTDVDITSLSRYKVTAVNDSGIAGEPTDELVCDPVLIPHAPEWEDLRVYDGYAKAQAMWRWSYGFRPDAYDIIRDGEVIAKDITVLNYIDTYIPAGTRRYEIVSIYYTYDANGNVTGRRPESARSSIRVANIVQRNSANELYGITEIYNYEITPDSPFGQSDVLTDFVDQNLYRQGAFYDGKWFIAQRWNKSNYADATSGGIYTVNADAGSPEAMAASARKIFDYPKGSNVGIAGDGHGSFFIRAGFEGEFEFTKPVTYGYLLSFDFNGNLFSQKTVDLSGVKDGEATMTFRSDYYTMTGDAYNGTANLYLCPSQGGSQGSTGKDGWRINISNRSISGSKVFNGYAEVGGVENYMFQLDGRDDMLHLVRSNGYYNVNPSTGHGDLLYSAYSRVNNAGGTSLWFNDDLFIITPQSQGSKNIGDFLVAKGLPDPDKLEPGRTKASRPEDVIVNYANIVPVVSVAQKHARSDAMNANGIWFGTKAFNDESGNPSHVDIYLYVPGLRFAKYRLYPFITLPGAGVEMNVDIQYEDNVHGDHIDITSFRGTATWPSIQFSGDYMLKLYHLQFINTANQVIEEHWFDSDGVECDADGNRIISPRSGGAVATGNGFSYSIDDLDSREYTARMTVTFTKANDATWTQTTEPSFDSDQTDYIPDAPLGQVKIVKERNTWADKDGVNRRNYRVDIDFNAPEFNSTGQPYPVTYYELWYRKPNEPAGTYQHRLTDLAVMNGGAKAIEHQQLIPGTYDFSDSKAQVVAGEGIPVVCCYFHQPEVGVDGNTLDSNEDPVNWEFVVRAKYAARAANSAIAKDRQTIMTPSLGDVTGVENVAAVGEDAEAVYPAITTGPVTVSSPAAIHGVAVYSIDGQLVMTAAGDRQSLLSLNLSHLPAGLYLISIDGHPGHKVMKR